MGYNILIVDDSRIIREMVKRNIEMSGLEVSEVHEAENGEEALAVMSKAWVDIVFADIHMPKMNGIEMVERMSQDNMLLSVPVVMVSSDRSEVHISRLRELGIRAYIKKPFRPEAFRDVVVDLLGRLGG